MSPLASITARVRAMILASERTPPPHHAAEALPPPSTPAPPSLLDHAAYPHIIAAIIFHADRDVLFSMRVTARRYLELVEATLARRQALVHIGVHDGDEWLYGTPEQCLPSLNSDDLREFLGLESTLPRLRARFRHVRAVEVHDASIFAKSGPQLCALLPNAVVRCRYDFYNKIKFVPASTVAVFWDMSAQNGYAQSPHIHPEHRRLVLNIRLQGDTCKWSRIVIFPSIVYGATATVPEHVINFSQWEFPPWAKPDVSSGDADEDVEASPHFDKEWLFRQGEVVRVMRDINDALMADPKNTVTLIDFDHFFAWFDPGYGYGAGRRISDPEALRTNLRQWFWHWYADSRPNVDRIHALSLAEHREQIGPEAFAAEAEW